MSCSWSSSVTSAQRQASHIVGSISESGQNVFGLDAKDGCWVEFAVFNESENVHLVLEWPDAKFLEEGSLGLSNFLILLDDSHGVDDFNLSLDNLGLDLQSLEESSLLRVETGGTWLNSHISGGE